MENFDYNAEDTASQDFSTQQGSANGTTAIKDRVAGQASEIKGKLTEQAKGVKEKVVNQASQVGSQLHNKIDGTREKTAGGLKSTSERIDRLAMYIQEHDSRQMSKQLVESSQQYVRQNPGKSLVIGLVAGMLLGRLFGGMMPHSHKRY